MTDPLSLGGAGAGGGILGGLLTFLGIRSKINDVDKRVDRLTDVVQFVSTCKATHEAIDKRLGRIEDGIDTLVKRK